MSDATATRRDEEMELHETVLAHCEDCGCLFFRAKEDPELLWEPGRAWEEHCRDQDCHCHTEPVIGRRRNQESVNPLNL
jgi:hypothetical protein